MTDNSITYVINSRDGFNGTTDNAHDLSISLRGMPSIYRKFKCEVKSFSLNVKSVATAFKDIQSQIFLSSSNFINSGLENSNSDIPNIVAYCDTISGTNVDVNFDFIVSNTNGAVRLTLLDTFTPIAQTRN